MSWSVWLTGLPGSGKSTVALLLKERMPSAVILRSDELRKIVTPDPRFSGEERDYVYKCLIHTAKTVAELGHDVIIDATGNRLIWRRLARKLLQNYHEVYLRCPLNICMERERMRVETHGAPRAVYSKSKKGAPVPGVNVEYEEPQDPELVIDSERTSPDEAADMIVRMIKEGR
jgi:adenylylsulfate kinase